MDDLTKLAKKLHTIDWRWDRQSIESIAADLGLVQDFSSGWWNWQTSASTKHRFADTALPVRVLFRGQQAEFLDVYLKAFDIDEDLLQSEHFYEALTEKTAEFRKDFKKTAAQIKKILGTPDFQGGADDPGYDEQDVTVLGADLLASWPLQNATLILKYEHQDKELPLTLELRVVPARKP
jgi:hypothetical protein